MRSSQADHTQARIRKAKQNSKFDEREIVRWIKQKEISKSLPVGVAVNVLIMTFLDKIWKSDDQLLRISKGFRV